MLKKTSIEWTDFTWNPVTGCDRISAGCDHCYALTMARRLTAMGLRSLAIGALPEVPQRSGQVPRDC